MTYEEMMILTEQHLESQVCGSLFLTLELDFFFSSTYFAFLKHNSLSAVRNGKNAAPPLRKEPFTRF